MQEIEKQIADKLAETLPVMTEREKDRFLGFLEGLGYHQDRETNANGPAA